MFPGHLIRPGRLLDLDKFPSRTLIQDRTCIRNTRISHCTVIQHLCSILNGYNIRGIDGKAIGIITTDGQLWKSLRSFSMLTLNKYFGLGKKSVETIIKEETEAVLKEFSLNEDVLIKFPFNISILNIIWRIV